MARGRGRGRRGSAILSVTLLGLLILAVAAALITITTTFNQQSYASNKGIVCRYAAEGVLQRIRYQLRQEDLSDAPGWFDAARTAADPVESFTVPATPASADTSNVEVSVYDGAEATALLGITLAPNEYVIEARARADKSLATLHMKVRHEQVVTTTTTESPNPSDLFSKYSYWANVSGGLVPGRHSGYIHWNGNLSVGSSTDRFALPITCTGTLTYLASPAWQHFDWDGNGFLDTTPRPEFENTSEQDVYNASGGNKPAVNQPAYQDVDTTLRSAAATQMSLNPTLAALFVDTSNPMYAGIGTLNTTQVSMNHNSGVGLTTATITVNGSTGTVTNSVTIPPNTPLVLYSSPRISLLGGTFYGQMTIATPFKGVEDFSRTIAGTPVLWPPSVEITDHLVQVDSQGHPKYWMTQSGSMMNQPSRLGLTGPSIDNTTNVDNELGDWTAANGYRYDRNPDFDPTARTVLGVLGNGDVVMAMSTRNFIWNAALYGADPTSRVSVKYGLSSSAHRNQVRAGSRVTSRFGLLGPPFDYTIRNYDPDLLNTPPPFWIAPAGVTTTTSTTTTITTSVGSIYERTRRF
ncbi:MAG TPA: hypothetical protein VI643_02660 [Planctomycetota bacterium]|nr:hypothetical protein [Planctomycetota bacterium]